MAEVMERAANLEARWDRKFDVVDRRGEVIDGTRDRRMLAMEEHWDRRLGALERRIDAGFAESRKELLWLMGGTVVGVLTVLAGILGALLLITGL